MSEVNKPTASEEARAAHLATERKKVKFQEKVGGQVGAQQQSASTQGKKLQSPFDEVLNKLSEQASPMASQETKFDSRLKETQRDQEHSSDRDKDDDTKDKQKTEGGKKSKESSETQHERVLGKQDTGGEGKDSSESGGQKEGKSGGGFQQKSTASEVFKADIEKKQPAPAPGPELTRLQLDSIQLAQDAASPRVLPKAVLDQIVQYVRIGMDKNLNKEIQIDFHDNFFNGVKLKVTSYGKEIGVEFFAPNRSVGECFKKEREKIATLLGEKGIDVRSITVTTI